MNIFLRHLIAAIASAGLTWAFWSTRPEWDSEMRMWKAIGDTSLVLLYATLVIGPVARFIRGAGKLLKYRHELGIWFGVTALLHTYLILDGWIRWDPARLMGYDFVPQANRVVRLESGFGMANIIGIVAVIIMIPIMITSGNWAIRFLGGSAWKYLHLGVYPVLYLVALHSTYFMYVHFSESFHRTPPPVNWAQTPFAATTFLLFMLQAVLYSMV